MGDNVRDRHRGERSFDKIDNSRDRQRLERNFYK